MKPILSISLLSVILFSCSSGGENKTDIPEQNDETPNKETSIQTNELKRKSDELKLIFSKATETFPSDSASLGRFYFKTFRAETIEKMQKQIDRINGLLDAETITKYNEVTNELKPLLEVIVRTNKITKEQAERCAYLYAIYDNYRGDALFSQVFSEDDNYSLVWKSMQMMVNFSKSDTTYISSLIGLNNSIRTNVELAEKAEEFVIEAIKNNPNGFLTMYSIRNEQDQNELARHAMMWDDPVPELISIFKEISQKADDATIRTVAEDLANKISQPL